jgi:sialate O-acetylesterase
MKKLITNLTFTLILLSSQTFLLSAEVKLPAIFGDNMVLQQQTDGAFWGKATPGANVTIKTSWNGKSYSARTDKDGNWKTKVTTPQAGGPYSITISDGTNR